MRWGNVSVFLHYLVQSIWNFPGTQGICISGKISEDGRMLLDGTLSSCAQTGSLLKRGGGLHSAVFPL